MSLINRMLKDVERRKPQNTTTSASARLRQLPLTTSVHPVRNSHRRWLWLFFPALLGWLIWLVY